MYMKWLSKTLLFPGKWDTANHQTLAQGLVDAALGQNSIGQRQRAIDFLGCCGSIKQLKDKGNLIHFVPPLESTNAFDKYPVIALDNVKFNFTPTADLFDDNHSKFMEFITCLFDYAYGNQVTILLATPNWFLAEKLVVLNGTSKIVLAKAAIRDHPEDPHYEQT
ncbi:hypothetical protein ACA910_019368 [Epithemia clementina (nom. ined.)]